KPPKKNHLASRRLFVLLNAKTTLRIMPDAANALSGLQTTHSRWPDKLREHRHLANQAISSAVLPFGAGYALSNCFSS
ncbi:hypothetical protein, partial [Escherichia coli]|uniref:hypothetical protein n=1 Tax=Escherichia coli TaxID=562 RepID=UPI003D0504E8